MTPSGQAQAAQAVASGTDSSSYKTLLQTSLNKTVPPLDVDFDKPVDKQKEAELSARPGTIILGVNLLTDLGSGEADVLKTDEDFTWLLKKERDEIIEMIIEDNMFDGEVIYTTLMGGVETCDPIYLVKWQNMSYSESTWEVASLIRK